MNAGRLNEIIKIQSFEIDKNEYGANGVNWIDKITTRANVQFQSGNRINENNEVVFTNLISFTIRIYHNIDEKDRIEWNGKSYKIISIEPNKPKQFLTIKTELINE
jgi:putative phage head-tail adaptor|nr:MAG TPA: putative head tail adaptor [Siphoviridae sp. ctTYz13]